MEAQREIRETQRNDGGRSSSPPIAERRARWGSSFPPAAVFLAALLLTLAPARSLAATPTEDLKGAVDSVIETLKRPDLKKPGKREERRAILREEITAAFDFNEMAKRSLGVNWQKRTPEERERFVTLFKQVLENSYLGKIESYSGEKIRYVKETVRPPLAVVQTQIITTKGQEIPVHYRMQKQGEKWRVYDVVIEGVSLVNNYRSQFASILSRSSFDDLLKRLQSMAAGKKEGGKE
jgi:phospholipid transport system substrate-binding protein